LTAHSTVTLSARDSAIWFARSHEDAKGDAASDAAYRRAVIVQTSTHGAFASRPKVGLILSFAEGRDANAMRPSVRLAVDFARMKPHSHEGSLALPAVRAFFVASWLCARKLLPSEPVAVFGFAPFGASHQRQQR
jgi:hypothetical protein